MINHNNEIYTVDSGARPALTFRGGFSPWTIIPSSKEIFFNSKISKRNSHS